MEIEGRLSRSGLEGAAAAALVALGPLGVKPLSRVQSEALRLRRGIERISRIAERLKQASGEDSGAGGSGARGGESLPVAAPGPALPLPLSDQRCGTQARGGVPQGTTTTRVFFFLFCAFLLIPIFGYPISLFHRHRVRRVKLFAICLTCKPFLAGILSTFFFQVKSVCDGSGEVILTVRIDSLRNPNVVF